jgi:DNA-directed RNA polymerase alpha subunit
MNPTVSNLEEDSGILKFTIYDLNISLANALRRVILSDIPCIVFRTSPYEENKAIFDFNTSRMNNEIIKQRLSCIPIHIKDMNFPIDEYQLEINVKNDTPNIIYVTTEHFKIKNIKTDTYLASSALKQIFPANTFTGNYIDFVRLRPKLSENIDGEYLSLRCGLSIGTAKEDGAFNMVSTCSYGLSQDITKIQEEWDKKRKELLSNNTSPSDIEDAKKDWLLLDAKRIVKKDSFDFIIETIGVYDNFELIEIASKIMMKNLKAIVEKIQGNSEFIKPSTSTIDNAYDIILENEDYTIGKVLEFIMYDKYFINSNDLTYCGFMKPHPHLDYSILRLAFSELVDNSTINTFLLSAANDGIEVFSKIVSRFSKT